MPAPVVPAPDLALAEALLAQLRHDSGDGIGVTRDAYGRGEQAAHMLLDRTARELGLEVARDGALNLYITLPGADRGLPRVMTGSHLDSVPCGGNYDGAAGVVAGLAVLAGWRKAGFLPAADTTVMGIRAEESTWFPYSYLGSKAAFGLVDRAVLQLPRADTGRPLAAHLVDCGGDPEAFGAPYLDARHIARFVELHIEQGPVLVEEAVPTGIVTGIRGSFRYREARITGEYAHSGAVPRAYRRDAVRAAALFMAAVDQDWASVEAAGGDLVVTFGQVGTDPTQHAFSKVAGRVDFCLDVRSQDDNLLATFDTTVRQRAAEVAAATGVVIDLGARTGSAPARMDPGIQRGLEKSAAAHGIAARVMASGAGHDAAVFAQQGVPAGMVFVRNECGSHNPHERMALGDFGLATRLLADALAFDATHPRSDSTA